ncbi:dynamin family protein [Solwaraspora sp. WMMD406]|uniref:dynamin family protein n=1 Tax=Solwaraspora sp. WMMD406 TaxID=3016095 RepID=UPI002415AC48|nr:dynamin family protein [Solwaraspora sp. WMMD406]MDG4766146.1 dynamin family protein [Solwaraspora sp. WMMD406]MDG4768686.1 dynamin family protein [Solwaraspora sp. WMMD406]MDG4768690.1 dynamin family protein [Solwaraspora sp. WMMD406]
MSGGPSPAALGGLLSGAVDTCLGFVRGLDPDAAVEIDALRRREVTRPSIVVVGETKRGKSSLVNALIGVTDLSPVDAAVATSAYLEFAHGPRPAARAFVPGREDPVPVPVDRLRDWGTVLGRLPDGTRPPRRIEVDHPAPLLQYLSLVDTPGTGGLDPAHTEIALAAVERAAALLFVVDASTPFTRPEMDFLIEASKRVNVVVFALTKVDAYPGWRTILADNQAQLQAHAPRFAAAGWFPVSARLAELALTVPPEAATELVGESRVAPLQHALVELAGKGHLLAQANVLRTIRSELVRLDLAAGQRIAACDPDPSEVARAREERAAVAARKRTESRQWSLALNTETQRARVEATGRLRTAIGGLQEHFLTRIEAARGETLKNLPGEVDQALHALSLRFSHDLEFRFRKVAERTLAQVFGPQELQFVLQRINGTLRHALATRPRREGGGADNMMIALSAGGMAFMAGRGAAAGASALGAGALVGGGLLIPVAGLGLGLAAGAFILYRRRVASDRQQARVWLREVLGEARAALADEVVQRFTDLQYALTLALDDAIERRLAQLDAHIAEIDKALAQDKASRAKRRAALQSRRDTIRARVKQVDEVLSRARTLSPAPTSGTATR